MDELIAQTRAALNTNLYYLSLFSALTVPDICGALDSQDGVATGARYRGWYRTHVLPRFNTLSPEECYRYRCTALHQGRSEPSQSVDYDRVIFIEPAAAQRIQINVKRRTAGKDTASMIHLRDFVTAIADAADAWLAHIRGTEPFDTNYRRFMHRHPTGFKPFVSGPPIITDQTQLSAAANHSMAEKLESVN